MESSGSEIQTLVGQIVEARSTINEKLTDLQTLVESLRKVVRRERGDAFSSYMVFVNSHSRLAAALSSGIQRTSAMDRVLDRALGEIAEEKSRRDEELRKAEERRLKREEQQRSSRSWLPPEDPDFEELFGEVLDAE